MASPFLLTELLAPVLRKIYHQADIGVTVSYTMEKLVIGPYRVLVKPNYNTACWIPPTGSRDSHTIYYGDRMLHQVFHKFAEKHEVSLPSKEDLIEAIKTKFNAAVEAYQAEVAGLRSPTVVALANLAKKHGLKLRGRTPALKYPAPTEVCFATLDWLKDHLDPEQWEELGEWLVSAARSYGTHERQHARLTSPDMKQVQRDLKLLGIPFRFFNLFEDARIEHHYRLETGNRFDWELFEKLAPMDHPFNIFLRCIQREGAPDPEAMDSEEPYAKDPERTIGHVAESIETYYQRACACSTTEALYPVITEFLEEFKEDLKDMLPPSGGGGAGGSGAAGEGEGEPGGGSGKPGEFNQEEEATDLSAAAEAAEKGDEFFESFEEGAEVVGGTDEEGKAAEERASGKGGDSDSGKGSKGQGIPDSIAPQATSSARCEEHFLAKHAGKISEEYAKRVAGLTSRLMQLFKQHTLVAATESPGRRMSGRHLARGELRFLHKKVLGGKGKRKFSVIYDCSGSMNGRPDIEGKLFLLSLNNLARRGFVQGSLILSGWVHGPSWVKYEFPVAEDVILRIAPSHASEGLQNTLEDNLKSIVGMDDVFVYTDACICDAPINRDLFASRHVWPVGLYVGDDDQASEMERHFPQNIIRHTIEAVVESMLIRNRRTVG